MKPTAYVINLDRRPDRWARMQELWSPWFTLIRWPAVDMPGKGAEGCKRSHVTLAEQVLAREKFLIVLEDDAIPTKKFREHGLALLEEAAKHIEDWDYINCGPCLDPKFTGRTFTRVSRAASPLFFSVDFSYRTHFVLYNHRSLPLLRATLDSDTEIDLHLGHNSRHQWVPRHVLAVQAKGPSDIHKKSSESGQGYLTTEQMLTTAKTKYSIMNKPCLTCYLPPGTSVDVTDTLSEFKLEQLLFSEATTQCAPFTQIKGPPSIAGGGAEALKFLTAYLLAKRGGFTHMIYLTVNKLVDADKLWSLYDTVGKTHACAGRLTIGHRHAMTGHAVKDAGINLLACPDIVEYGGPTSPAPHKPCVYPELPASVWPVDMITSLFPNLQSVEQARKFPDLANRIGHLLWAQYAGAVFDYVVHLNLTAPVTTDTPPTEPSPKPAVIVASGEQPALTPVAGAVIPNINITVPQPDNQVRVQEMANRELTNLEKPFHLRVDILIVTCEAEFTKLSACLESIVEFCDGFGTVTLVMPKGDEFSMPTIYPQIDITVHTYNPVEGKADECATYAHCCADTYCPDADLVLHLPASMVFTSPTTPADFFRSGKPSLLMTPYSELKLKHPERFACQAETELILKEPVRYLTSEGWPVIHWREAYCSMRGHVETRQGLNFHAYVMSEPVNWRALLGACVLRNKDFIDRYFFHNLARLPMPVSHIDLQP